jgi:hypothetical protein
MVGVGSYNNGMNENRSSTTDAEIQGKLSGWRNFKYGYSQ